MISLLIDTSANRLIIGIYKDKKQLYFENTESNNDLSRKVLPKIKDALEQVSLTINNVDEIYVVNGPGSFTGIRVGVTIAKTLAWALNIKVYTISELKLLATTNTEKKYNVPMIDARRGFVYAGMYDNNLKEIIADQYISKDELLEKIQKDYNLDDINFISYDELANVSEPIINIEKLFSKAKFKELNPHSVNPNYLKKTEAEENLNDKKNN